MPPQEWCGWPSRARFGAADFLLPGREWCCTHRQLAHQQHGSKQALQHSVHTSGLPRLNGRIEIIAVLELLHGQHTLGGCLARAQPLRGRLRARRRRAVASCLGLSLDFFKPTPSKAITSATLLGTLLLQRLERVPHVAGKPHDQERPIKAEQHGQRLPRLGCELHEKSVKLA